MRFDTAPITREELEIIYESDVQADRNKQLYSKDMKGEKDFDYLFDDPIELKENERLRIGYPNTDRNPFRVYPSYDVWHNGKIIISIDKSEAQRDSDAIKEYLKEQTVGDRYDSVMAK